MRRNASQAAVMIADLCRFIERADVPPTLAALSERAGLSPHHLQRLFSSMTGLSPRKYAMAVRARRLRDELASAGTITPAIYAAGFGSSGRFYEQSNRILGMKPDVYRRSGEGETILFAVGECSLGAILVARSSRGVCAITLGDEPEPLVHALEDRFRRATIVGGDASFEGLVAEVVGLIERPEAPHALPLDVRGTAFQERVWRALTEIPPGTTVSYSELAARIGQPKSTRAVARAVAQNPVAVAIPCHRVVRRDGSLSGYRWGVERKRALLEREAAPTKKRGGSRSMPPQDARGLFSPRRRP